MSLGEFEPVSQTAAKAGREMLDGYVRWLEQVAEQQRKLASGPPVSQVDWLAAMLNAQADFTRQFASALRGLPGRARRVIVPAMLRGSRRHERWRSRRRGPLGDAASAATGR